MSKVCPLTNGRVLYAECLECDVRQKCHSGMLSIKDYYKSQKQ